MPKGKKKTLVGWKKWDKKNLPKGVVFVMFMESRVFPKGAIVQAHADEVTYGVIGDKNPTYWRRTSEEETCLKA